MLNGRQPPSRDFGPAGGEFLEWELRSMARPRPTTQQSQLGSLLRWKAALDTAIRELEDLQTWRESQRRRLAGGRAPAGRRRRAA